MSIIKLLLSKYVKYGEIMGNKNKEVRNSNLKNKNLSFSKTNIKLKGVLND